MYSRQMVARPTSVNPTELELSILKILWGAAGWLQVRGVREQLASLGRDLAHTTVITTLNTMFDKKYVKRKKSKNALVFTSRVTQNEVSGKMLGDVYHRVFDQSARALMLSLFEAQDIQADELEELKQILEQKLKEQKS